MSDNNSNVVRLIPDLPKRRTGRTSFEVFRASLHAFLLRELKNQFGRSRLGYFWALAEPSAAVAIFTVLHAVIRGGHAKIYHEHPVVFFVFGVIPYFMFSNALSQTQGVCGAQKGLFNYRQIKPIDVMMARVLIDALMLAGVMCLFIFCWSWFGMAAPKIEPLELLLALCLLSLFGFGVGLNFEVYGTVFPDMRKVFSVITRPLFFVSGVFFTMQSLPEGLLRILQLNPILHGIDLTRQAVLSGYDSPASWGFLIISAAIALALGLAAYRRYQFRLL